MRFKAILPNGIQIFEASRTKMTAPPEACKHTRDPFFGRLYLRQPQNHPITQTLAWTYQMLYLTITKHCIAFPIQMVHKNVHMEVCAPFILQFVLW